ncbi:MAG: methyltransferase domain-containing protein [Candidatus Alcyoniella australis]|nr:methyltransferase domain-containing protein [Candidatus Alcyoniella australis]
MDPKSLAYVAWAVKQFEISEPVLEIGAGWKPDYYRRLFGSRAYITQDIRSYQERGVKLDIICDAADMRGVVDDCSIGTLLCLNTLEHVAVPQTIIDEAQRVLVPGGRLIVTVPTRCPIHRAPKDYWRIMPDGMAWLLREFQLEDMMLGRSRTYPSVVNTVSRKLPQGEQPQEFDLGRARMVRENSAAVNTVDALLEKFNLQLIKLR